MPHVYYIRHGETEWNALGRFQGHRDIALNERGRAQASAAGSILLAMLSRDGRSPAEVDFVSSPLSRAVVTMQLVRTALALPPDGYRTDDRLREISYGDWEGLTYPEMKSRDAAHFALREADLWRVPAPGGETFAEVTARMGRWFAELRCDTVVVAHGGTMRALTVALGAATPLEAAGAQVMQGAVYCFSEGAVSRHS